MRIGPLIFVLGCLALAVPSPGRGQERMEKLLEELTNAPGVPGQEGEVRKIVLRERIAKKAAPAETQISREYLEEVVRAYEHFFFRYSASDLLVVNTSEIDFVERNED